MAHKPKLLSGENPQIAKGDGDAPVQAYIAAVPGWKQEVCRQIDRLVVEAVPEVRKAVKWNSPFYSAPGEPGWFMNFHCFKSYVKVAFFQGALIKPMPPGESTQGNTRYLDIHEKDAIDAVQVADWIRQASKLPGIMGGKA